MGSSKKIDFGREDIKGGYLERPDGYSAKRGRTDRIRILTDPVSYFGARVGDENTGFFAISRADHDDIEAGNFDKCEKDCPLFARGYGPKIKQRFCVLVHHISSTDGKGREKKVDQILPWNFPKQKYEQLHNIAKNLPLGSKSGKPLPLRTVELSVSCEDEKFQKIHIAPITDPGRLSCRLSDSWELAKEYFEDDKDPSSECSLVVETVSPEPKQELLASLDRIEKKIAGGGGDEFDDDKPKAKKGKKKPAAEEADEEEEIEEDEDLEDVEDDAEDEEDAEDDETEEPAPKKAAKGGGRAAPPARKNKVANDEEDAEAFKSPKKGAAGKKDGKMKGVDRDLAKSIEDDLDDL